MKQRRKFFCSADAPCWPGGVGKKRAKGSVGKKKIKRKVLTKREPLLFQLVDLSSCQVLSCPDARTRRAVSFASLRGQLDASPLFLSEEFTPLVGAVIDGVVGGIVSTFAVRNFGSLFENFLTTRNAYRGGLDRAVGLYRTVEQLVMNCTPNYRLIKVCKE